MAGLHRFEDETPPDDAYRRSYLRISLVVGGVGFLLSITMLVLEVPLKGRLSFRDSFSAYYHSGARDLFVGALVITGCMLITYLSRKKQTWDYWLSTFAGFMALGVAFLPTNRPDPPYPSALHEEPRCKPNLDLVPPRCTGLTAIQEFFGEGLVKVFHFGCASLFIVSLGIICWFIFALSEKNEQGARRTLHRGYAVTIGVALLCIGIGESTDARILIFTPLYFGESLAVYAFSISWLARSGDIWTVDWIKTILEKADSWLLRPLWKLIVAPLKWLPRWALIIAAIMFAGLAVWSATDKYWGLDWMVGVVLAAVCVEVRFGWLGSNTSEAASSSTPRPA